MGIFSNLQTLTGQPRLDVLMSTLAASDEDRGFLLNQVAPSVFVDKRKGSIPITGYDDKIENDSPRADNQEAPESGNNSLYQVNYQVKALDEKRFIPAGLLGSDAANGELLRQTTIMALGQKISLKAEKKFIDTITTAANYPTAYKTTAGATDKFDYSSGTSYPVKYLLNKALIAKKLFGMFPDSIMFSLESFIAFASNPTVVAAIPTIQFSGALKEGNVGELLSVGALKFLKNVYIHSGTFDENAKKDTRSSAYMMSDDVILFKKAQAIGENITMVNDSMNGIITPGAFVTAVSTLPADIGETVEPVKGKKGEDAEARLSVDTVMMRTQDKAGNYMPFAYIIKDTNE